MKNLKHILAGALVLACVGSVDASTVIRFTGSTAFRTQTQNAIYNVFDAGVKFGWSDSGVTKVGSAKQAIYHGTIGGVDTYICTSFNGSEAGIQEVAAPAGSTSIFGIKFIPITTPDSSLAGGTFTGGGASGLAAGTDVQQPDVAMSDTTQTTSQFKKGSKTLVGGVNYTYSQLYPVTGGALGVVPFKWAATGGCGFSNITPGLAKSLYGAGSLPKALFTGANADEGTYVYAIGRNPDSGTRLSAFAEAGLGALASVVQMQPYDGPFVDDGSGNMIPSGAAVTATGKTIASFKLWPQETINQIVVAEGNSGFSSGGNLSAVLSDAIDSSIAGTVFVGYAGTSDIDGYITAGTAQELAWNGVTLGVSSDYNTNAKLLEGQYSFWSYEYMYTRDASPSSVVTAIANNITTTTAPVKLTSMKVTRPGDGQPVVNNY